MREHHHEGAGRSDPIFVVSVLCQALIHCKEPQEPIRRIERETICRGFMRFFSQIIRSPFDLLHYATLGQLAPRHHVLVACMPKSGSTFLSNTVSRLPGFRKATLVRHYGRVEQDLDPFITLRKNRYDYVAQHHVKYNENTQFVIETFNIKPVVLVRNLFDCVVSFRDHLRRESTIGPSAWIGESHKSLSDEELDAMIAHVVIPWYINFYVSWQQAPEKLMVTYNDMVGDTAGTLGKVVSYLGLTFDDEQIGQVLAPRAGGQDRFNVGQVGRGEGLSEESKAVIRRFRSFYPEIDFSPVGLD